MTELTASMSDAGLWNDKKRAEEILREMRGLKSKLDPVESFDRRLGDGEAILQLAREEGDTSILDDVEGELRAVGAELEAQEVRTLFADPDDERNAILSIHPGAGGTESMDWAEMLLRMYTRYCERRGFSVHELETMPGEEAGIKSASLEVRGDFAHGLLKSESGVHRLVRISPYDAQSRRHTSFASVFVYPEIENDVEVEIRPDDLEVDTFRASGAGGQHVNKTDSAVRIRHVPTGIVVQCQNERSQHRNRDNAMKILRARLYALKLEEERAKMEKMMEGQREIAWGSQIRSYVLHPYTMVKDHRTDEQVGDVYAVLDGDIDRFVDAYLHKFVKGS